MPSEVIFLICAIVLIVISFIAWVCSRYKKCPSDKILIVYGNVGAGRSAKCIHGGATFVLPLIQSHAFMDLNPLNIDVPLKGALSSQNIRFPFAVEGRQVQNLLYMTPHLFRISKEGARRLQETQELTDTASCMLNVYRRSESTRLRE